jgi:hypothetical protein
MADQYIYTGTSWADSSYPVVNSSTNLAREWGISYINMSQTGSGVLELVKRIKKSHLKLPIIWIYNEPFVDLTAITNMSYDDLLQRSDWEDLWNECNQYCLSAIASLDVPILLIGGGADIVDCNHSTIRVGHNSWQKWLAKEAGMSITNDVVSVTMDDGGDFQVDRAWGAEILHRHMHEHPEIDPDKSLMNSIWDIFFFWKELEKSNLFYDVHPNLLGNQLFAKFLLPIVKDFLQENK